MHSPDLNPPDDAALHNDDLDTYQALLDESLALTFPASDPVCAHAATRCGEPRLCDRDEVDWSLRPGSTAAPADPEAHGGG
jgi:hypothetical protein